MDLNKLKKKLEDAQRKSSSQATSTAKSDRNSATNSSGTGKIRDKVTDARRRVTEPVTQTSRMVDATHVSNATRDLNALRDRLRQQRLEQVQPKVYDEPRTNSIATLDDSLRTLGRSTGNLGINDSLSKARDLVDDDSYEALRRGLLSLRDAEKPEPKEYDYTDNPGYVGSVRESQDKRDAAQLALQYHENISRLPRRTYEDIPVTGEAMSEEEVNATLARFDSDIAAAEREYGADNWYTMSLRRARDQYAADPSAYKNLNLQESWDVGENVPAFWSVRDNLAIEIERADEEIWRREQADRWNGYAQEAAEKGWEFTEDDYTAFIDRAYAEQGKSAAYGVREYKQNYTYDEAYVYQYVLDNYGQAEADEFESYLQPMVAQRTNEKNLEALNLEDNSFLYNAVGSTLFNIGKIENTLDIKIQLLDKWVSGSNRPVDYYTTGGAGMFSNAMREENTARLAEYGDINDWLGTDIPFLEGIGLDTLYNTGQDFFNSVANGLVFGKNLAGAAMGLEKYSDEYADASERGLPSSRADKYATASAFAEGLGEAAGIFSFLGTVSGIGRVPGWKAKVGLGILQSVEGGLGEGLTTVAEQTADKWFAGKYSHFNLRVDELVANGYSTEDAQAIAQDEAEHEIFVAILMGMVRDAVPTAAGGTISNVANTRNTGAAIRDIGNADMLTDWYNDITGKNRTTPKTAAGIGRMYNQLNVSADKYIKAIERAEMDEAVGARYEQDVGSIGPLTEEQRRIRDMLIRKGRGGRLDLSDRLDLRDNAPKTLTALDEFDIRPDRSKSTEARARVKATPYLAQYPLAKIKAAAETAAASDAESNAVSGTTAEAKERAESRLDNMNVDTKAKATTVDGEEVKVTKMADVAHGDTEAKVTVEKADGSTADVNISEVTFGRDTNSEVLAYASDMATPELANKFRMFAKSGKNLDVIANAVHHAYDMAVSGYRLDSVQKSSLTNGLSDAQISIVHSLGVADRAKGVTQKQATAAAKQTANGSNAWTSGRINMGDVVYETLSSEQKRNLDLVDVIAKLFGVNVEIFESKANSEGKYTAENGSYNKATNTIRLDINAGRNYKGDSMAQTAMLRTMSHELTHAMQRNQPAQYEAYRNAVLDVLKRQGADINDLVDRKMASDGSLKTRDAAIDEIVADASETMLRDSDAVERLRELHPEQAKSFARKVLKLIKRIKDAIREAFGNGKLTKEAQYAIKELDKLAAMWSEMAVATAEVSGRELSAAEDVAGTDGAGYLNVEIDRDNINLDEIDWDDMDASNDRDNVDSDKIFRPDKIFRSDYIDTLINRNNADTDDFEDFSDFRIEPVWKPIRITDAVGREDTINNTEAFNDTLEAIQNQARPPYTDGTKACTEFVESLNTEAKATYDLLYNFYQASRLGKQNLSSKFMYFGQWNEKVRNNADWAERAKAMAATLPDDVRRKMNMNPDGTLNPTSLEVEFKMNRSMGQRIIDALETEVIDTKYTIEGTEYTLSKGNATTAVGGEAYRRAICEEVRKAYHNGTLKQAGIGTLSKDRWGSLGFLASNGKTGASGDFTTLCPQMFYNKGCHYCYRLAALKSGVNNKLGGANVWYGGEILRIKDADIDRLNKNGGLRIQSFGDWMPQFSSQLADMLYDADMRGLQIKIITKEPSMIEYVALLREQGLGKSLYFNLSADYAIERAGNRETADYTTMNTERPYMRDAKGDLWWKRAMTVQEANRFREKYDWVNTRIVATTQEEFIRGLKDPTVDVVTGYHGNIREWERIDSETGNVLVNVEALGDAGMPRFAFDAATGEWSVEYEGKTATHKALAKAIATEGLQYEYYIKTCCITGRCATCEGKCGRLAKDFNIKNATNRDAESVAYWQQQMEYDEAGENDLRQDDVQYSARVSDPETLRFLDNQETVTTYKTMQVVDGKLYPPMAAVVAGSYEDASELGAWEQATEHPELIKYDKGKPKFVLKKGKGKGDVPAAYNPYMHSSNLVLNDQFSSAYNRPNLVTVECEVPVSELTSGYHAQYAKDSVGWHSWHTGTVAGALRKAKGIERQVLLSRWIKPVRIVPDAEVAQMYKELLDGTGVSVPDNVVPPNLLNELEKAGVSIAESGKVDRNVQLQARNTDARNRALRKGEMVNDFREVLKNDWVEYYNRINHDPAYSPDLYDDGDRTSAIIGDKLLIMEMQNNGEFAVVDVYRGSAISYNNNKTYDQFVIQGGRDAYAEETLFDWAAAFADDDGENLPERYDRVRKRFVPLERRQTGPGKGIDRIHREGAYGGGILETAPAENEADLIYQARPMDALSDREILANALEDVATTPEEKLRLAAYKEGLDRLNEKQAELDKYRQEITELTNKLRGNRKGVQDIFKTLREKSELTRAERTRISRLESVINEYENATRHAPLDKQRYEEALAGVQELAQKAKLNDAEYAQWRDAHSDMTARDEARYLGKEDYARLQKARNNARMLSDQVTKADKDLLNLERMEPIRAIVKREGDKVRERMKERIADVHQIHKNAALRQSIVRRVKRLNDILINPTDTRHVPDEFKLAVKNLMQAFTDDTSVFDKETLRRLSIEYDAIAKSASDAAKLYDDSMAEIIKELGNTIGGRRLSKLTEAELKDVRNVVDHFQHVVSDANNVFFEGRRQAIDSLATEEDFDLSGKQHYETRLNTTKLAKWLKEGQTIPVYFFRRLGGVMGKLGNAILEAEGSYGVEVNQARTRLQQIMEKYNHKEWANKKNDTLTFTTEEGVTLTFTREEALGLYATDKRERLNVRQEAHHLSNSGITFKRDRDDLKWVGKDRRRPVMANAAKISKGDMRQINAWLTAEQKAYADEMVEYLSTDMARLGNETSRQLHGYSKFDEGYYYPYKTNADFFNTKLDNVEAALIKNMRHTKRTVRHASNPLVITDFTTTVAEHVNNMLLYHNFAVPQDAFMRVYDHHLSTNRTVKTAMKSAYGEGADRYITQLMKDMYGGITRDPAQDFVAKLQANYKKSAVMLSASVVIQQPSSIVRAFAQIDPKYFVHLPHTGGWNEAMQYAGTAVIKEIGGFDTSTGKNIVDWMTQESWADGVMDGINKAGGALPGMADQATWGAIWNAVKQEQADQTGLDINSEELKQKAGKRFDEVIRLTQVYDSTLSRSQNMRSSSGLMKVFTAFMGEPTVTYNMMYDAFFTKNRGLKHTSKTLAAVLGSIVLNAALKSLVTAARDDDDEEATYLERYINNVTGSLWSDLNPLNYVPVARDAWSALQGFTVERTDMEIFNAARELLEVISNEDKTTEDIVRSVITFGSLATGIPAKNVVREIDAVRNIANSWGNELREGAYKHAALSGVADQSVLHGLYAPSGAELLYKAALKGNDEDVARYREYMILYKGKDDKQINTSLRSEIKKGYLKGDMNDAQAIEILTEYAGLNISDAEDRVLEWSYEREVGSGIGDEGSTYDAMKEDYLNGDITRKEAIDSRVRYGGASESDAEALVLKWDYEKETGIAYDDMKDEYIVGNISRREAEAARVKYGGRKKEDAAADVLKWDYEKRYGHPYTDMKDEYLAGRITKQQAIDARVKYGGVSEKTARRTVEGWDDEK